MGDAPHLHQHDHAHEHGHTHDHEHAHEHEHFVRAARPPASLLRMSAPERLTVAAGAVAAIWLGVFWAIGLP